MNNLDIYVNIDPRTVMERVAEEMDEDDIISLIMQMDYMMADYGFTKKLIKRLKKSLKNEGF